MSGAARHASPPDGGSRPAPARPEGNVLWFHATQRAHADVALRLAERLSDPHPRRHLLLTAEAGAMPPGAMPDNVFQDEGPGSTGMAAQAFLDHWRPDIAIIGGGHLPSRALNMAHRRGIALLLVDADAAMLPKPRPRWLPDATRRMLNRFAVIMAHDSGTETLLRRRFGLRDAHIVVTGPLREYSRPLPCNEDDYQRLSDLLRRRPVWLAAQLDPEEIDIVLDANSQITRMSHRMLLIIVPRAPEQAEPFKAALRRAGLRHVVWSGGALPDDTTQVILADTRGELGLWYRLAPICLLGGSLCAGAHGSDPSEPAAHGSAILYGPNIRNFLPVYARFAEAGAARIVRDARTLAEAVEQVMSPERSAAMAHAAWDVATVGAAALDQLIETVDHMLDGRAAD